MIESARLAGVAMAHAIWSISDGDRLVTIVASLNEQGDYHMGRIVGDSVEAEVKIAKQQSETLIVNGNDVAMVYEGQIGSRDHLHDALIVEFRSADMFASRAVFAVPYSHDQAGQFRVYNTCSLHWENFRQFDIDQGFDDFFCGADSHDQGSAVWQECLDDSDALKR